MADETKETKSGYGKRSLWQWLLIYLIIGGIVYFLVYYFVFAKNGNGYNYGSGGSNDSTNTEQGTPSLGY